MFAAEEAIILSRANLQLYIYRKLKTCDKNRRLWLIYELTNLHR